MKNKKNVVFFVTGLDSGGLENYLLRFLNMYADYFNNIIVYCKGGKGGQLEVKYKKIGNVSIVQNKIGYYNVFDYWKLGSFLKKEKIDIVCDFTGDFAGGVHWVAKQTGIQKRVTFYRNTSHRFKGSFLKHKYTTFVNNLTYRFSSNILSNSQLAFDFFYKGKRIDNRFEVIHNGINANEFKSNLNTLHKELEIPVDAFVIGHVGRFNEAKNHPLLIKLANDLAEEYKNMYFLFCGNGVKNNLLKEVNLNVQKQVFLFENREDIVNILNTLDLFLFPSFTEGQPNALIEAAIVGVPFVASNIEPIKETVGRVYGNRLFEPTDYIGFREKIIECYEKKEKHDVAMSEFFVQKFNHEVLFTKFLKVLIDE